MKQFIKIMVGAGLCLGVAAVHCKNPTITYKNAFNKTSTLGKRQTKALMACTFFQILIDKKDDSLDLHYLVKDLPDYVQDNILFLISIFPSKCWKEGSDKTKNEETLKDEIDLLLIAQEDKLSFMFNLIKCAQTVGSHVRNDLIHYVLQNRFIDHNVLKQPNFTSKSLKKIQQWYESIKNDKGFKPQDIVPDGTIDTLIKQQEEEEKNFDAKIITIIRTKFYESKKKKYNDWLKTQVKKIQDLTNEKTDLNNFLGARLLISLEKYTQKELNDLFLPSVHVEKLRKLNLENKLHFIGNLHSALDKTNNLIEELCAEHVTYVKKKQSHIRNVYTAAAAGISLLVFLAKLLNNEFVSLSYPQILATTARSWLKVSALIYAGMSGLGFVILSTGTAIKMGIDYKNNQPVYPNITKWFRTNKDMLLAFMPLPLSQLGLDESLIKMFALDRPNDDTFFTLLEQRKKHLETMFVAAKTMVTDEVQKAIKHKIEKV